MRHNNITIFIECLAFFGLICCLFIYNANSWFLGILITFVSCETIMEILEIKLKTRFAYIYNAIFLFGITLATIISNGFQLSSVFAVFFITVLLALSQYGFITESSKQQVLHKEI